MTTSDRFEAYDNALNCVRTLRGVLPTMARADGGLAKQLRRAASSIVLNVAEARGRKGRDRAHLFAVALGSAREALAALDVAEAWGDLRAEQAANARTVLDRQCGLLYRLSR